METTTICNHNQDTQQVASAASDNKCHYRSAKDVIVSHGERVFKPENMETDYLYTMLYNIKVGTWKNIITKVRAIADKNERNKFKTARLGFFNIGEFRNSYRNNENVSSTEFMIFDFDHLGETLEEKKAELKSNPCLYALFVSPSGDGLKAVFRLNKPITDKGLYSPIYKYYAARLNADLGDKPDKTSDISRSCFFSYDPDVYLNEYAAPLETEIDSALLLTYAASKPNRGEKNKGKKNSSKKKVQAEKADMNSSGFTKINLENVSLQRLEMLNSMNNGAAEGSRNTTLVKNTGLLINMGIDLEFIMSVLKGWNLTNKPPLPEDELERTVHNLYDNHASEAAKLPMIFREKNNQYLRFYDGKEKILSTFIVEPKELLQLKDTDCLKADIITKEGRRYKDIHFEISDWHSRSKFLKAIGRQECVFLGSDTDLLGLCGHVSSKVKIKKTGTKVIGLHADTWVVKNCNITKEGISKELSIVPFDKGGDAFYNRIEYKNLSEKEYESLVHGFYSRILRINDPNVIIPWLSWIFASPMKPKIMELTTCFPIMYAQGTYGFGKSGTGKVFQRLLGYKSEKPDSAKLKEFPMLKLLSSTNAIPVTFDEFKKDIGREGIDDILRFMRRSYGGEIETKGRQDQTVESYEISAPMALIGELDITEGAVKERVLLSRFNETAKVDKQKEEIYNELWKYPLEGFMPEYIKFCLNQNAGELYEKAANMVEGHFSQFHVDTRIRKNLAVMIMGYNLFKAFGERFNAEIEDVSISELLNSQLKEITGSDGGKVKSPLDFMFEEFSIMALNEEIKLNTDYRIEKEGDRLIVCLPFNKLLPKFREYARRTNYEHEIPDEESCRRQMNICPYITGRSINKKYEKVQARSITLDIGAATSAGLNLDGFIPDEDTAIPRLTSTDKVHG